MNFDKMSRRRWKKGWLASAADEDEDEKGDRDEKFSGADNGLKICMHSLRMSGNGKSNSTTGPHSFSPGSLIL